MFTHSVYIYLKERTFISFVSGQPLNKNVSDVKSSLLIFCNLNFHSSADMLLAPFSWIFIHLENYVQQPPHSQNLYELWKSIHIK